MLSPRECDWTFVLTWPGSGGKQPPHQPGASFVLTALRKPGGHLLVVEQLVDGIPAIEHDLLHHTLVGSIRALTDLLSAVSPVAFSRTPHLRRSLRHLAGALGAAPVWPFEIAALLAPIGWIALPAELIIKHYAGEQ